MRPRLASAHAMICLRSPILRAHWVQHWYTAMSFGLETRWNAHSRSRPRKEPHSAGVWGWKVSGQASISRAPALVELSSVELYRCVSFLVSLPVLFLVLFPPCSTGTISRVFGR